MQALLVHPFANQMYPILTQFLEQEEAGQPLSVLATTQLAPPQALQQSAAHDAVVDPWRAKTLADGSTTPSNPPEPCKVAMLVGYPEWVLKEECWERDFVTDQERMQLCIDISRKNMTNNTGGPFGAAVFEARSGRVVSLGVSLVDLRKNCCLHAETVAIQMATARLGTFALDREGAVQYELFASSEPCAMCIGAILWSGVLRLVCAATDVDVRTLLHDTGPVFEDSFKYLRSKGVTIERKFMRMEAKQVISEYSADHESTGRQV
eukprot:TRINITY_DN9198_c0_g1_i1.p1 TRINITY_DN9198_c0_g1~~TRINITY_DN9198_c0_g1_i1.p1  ORF type:complete len:283 (-),score=77.54 TRINITY_DN9198_c0_g1_i1:197-991(-)